MNRPSLVLLTPAFPPLEGGQEAHALALAVALTERNVAVRVITKRLAADYLPQESFGTVPVLRLTPIGDLKAIGWSGALGAGVFLLRTIALLIRERKSYDSVLVSGFNYLPLAAIAAGLFTGKPCVVRPESPMELQEAIGAESRAKMQLGDSSALMRFGRLCRKLTSRHVTRFVAISAQIEAGLIALGVDPGRITTIPNGIDIERFVPLGAEARAKVRSRLNISPEQQLVVYTGRLALSKGVMMLAQVWEELNRLYPNARLAMIGTGTGSPDSCEAELRKFLADRGLAGSVRLAGYTPQVQMWLQAADIFAFPSHSEGFGLSILEAMSVGVPMVTTRVGIAAQLPSSPCCALVVEPHDSTAFADALRRLLDNADLRASISAQSRSLVQREYSIQAVAAQYQELLMSLTPTHRLRSESRAAGGCRPPHDLREGT